MQKDSIAIRAKLKIYFDASPLQTGHAVRGVGYYTKNLQQYLREDENISLVGSPQDANVVHFPYFDLFFNTLKPINGKKNIVTIYDVIPLIYPKYYPPGLKGRINFIKQKRALKSVDAIITISETSKKDIVRFLDVPAEKVYVTYLAAQTDFRKMENGKWKMEITNRYNLPSRFVLYVGDVNYNKNILTLADACREIKIPLVIVGKQAAETNIDKSHPENKSFAQFLEKYGNDSDVLRLGFVETEDLVKIYNAAAIYCQSSLYEGFGLPVLEAMACGTPVVITRIQALVEVAGGAALISNSDAQSLAKSLEKLARDEKLQQELSKKGYVRAKEFSWKRTSKETVGVYKKVI